MSAASNQLFLVDGHALCYRSFFAIRELQNSKGQATNAVYGFVNMIRKILKDYDPKYLAICFDSKEKTHRQEKFKEYKIQRPKMPDDLISQIPIIKEVLKAFKVEMFELPGFEADDLLATITKKGVASGVEVVIASDDKDLYQLADKMVSFFSMRKSAILKKEEIVEKYGFDTKFIVDFLGLAGDSADNIPGVRGVGKVTASKLINSYGTMEDIYKHIDDVSPVKLQEKLVIDRDTAFLSKELAILESEIPMDINLEDLKVQDPDSKELFNLFQDLEFKRLAQEFQTEDEVEMEFTTKEISKSLDIEKLLKQIKKEKIVYLFINTDCSDLFESNGQLAISTNSKEVFLLNLNSLVEFKDIFIDSSVLKVVHNLKSSIKTLQGSSLSLDQNVFDTMLAGFLLKPSHEAANLNHLAWEYLSISLKEEIDCAQCVAVIAKLYNVLLKELKEKNLFDLLDNIEIPLSVVLAEIESTGVCLDTKFLKGLSDDCEKTIEGLTKIIYKLAGEEFNLNSPKQLSVILFEKLGLPVVKKTKTGFSTNEAVLTSLAPMHELPSKLLEYRQIAKLKSTYIDALPKLVNPKTKRLHAEFNQIGAETGRLSSKNPNLQNIPIRTELGRQVRKAIVSSSKNNIILAADYSQIELRILAHLSKDETLIKAFKNNQDIHTFTSALIFDVDEKDVTKDMRYAAKRVNFGIVYGMGAFGLSKDLEISPKEAQEFIDKYFERYPKVKDFMDEQIKLCEEKGFVSTLLNRRRYIPEINSPNQQVKKFAERQAINTPVQGSAADLIKIAMIEVQKEIEKRKLKSKMIMTVHDELVFDVLKSEKEEMTSLLQEVMEHSIKLEVPITITVKYGANWLEMKDVQL